MPFPILTPLPSWCHHPPRLPHAHLRSQLNDTTGILDLAFGFLAEESGSDDEWDLWDAALAEHLGVTERKEVEDGRGIFLLSVHVGFTGFFGDQRPQLHTAKKSVKLAKPVLSYPLLDFSPVKLANIALLISPNTTCSHFANCS